MTNMDKKDFFYFGRVVKTKGIKGEIGIFMDVDEPVLYRSLDAFFIERKRDLIPFLIQTLDIEGNKATVKLEGINSIEEAEMLTGCPIYLPLALLPALKEDQFYYHEIEGFEMIDQHAGRIGTIKEVMDIPRNPLFVVQHGEKEILIPVMDEIIEKIDRKEKKIYISAPEGLIDIYLEN